LSALWKSTFETDSALRPRCRRYCCRARASPEELLAHRLRLVGTRERVGDQRIGFEERAKVRWALTGGSSSGERSTPLATRELLRHPGAVLGELGESSARKRLLLGERRTRI